MSRLQIKPVLRGPRIEQWSTCCADEDPFRAPELRGLAVQGNVYGHPDFTDGTHIKTAPILSAKGRRVKTRDGVFVVGEADPEFVAWWTGQGKAFDPENPIRTGVRAGSTSTGGDA